MPHQKIAILIPEFPGQTHSFFWREILALKKHHGIETLIISTRLPAKPVHHDWVDEAKAVQLYPISFTDIFVLFPAFIVALPMLLRNADARRILWKPKAWLFLILALKLARLCKSLELTHMHVHSCANFALIAAFCKLASGPSYSLVLHGPLHDYGEEQPFKWRHADFVFVITEHLYKELPPEVQAPKVFVVPMGVNTDYFSPPSIRRPSEPALFTWFCCARLNRVKGYDVLISAASKLRQSHSNLNFLIRIAGEDEFGGSGYHRELDQLIAESGISDIVEILGSVTQNTVLQELQAADGFVLASLHEPLGVAYMEAMACALPVIGTDAGGVTELITHGHDGILVPPRDVSALADAMARLMLDGELRQTIGDHGRKRIVEDFNSRRSADALANALS